MAENNKRFQVGVDVGSTTAKLAIIDPNGELVFSGYERHNTKIHYTVWDLLGCALEKLGDVAVEIKVTGSAGIGLSEKASIPFTQEVIATTEVVKLRYPDVKILIDIGGEDSKMIFFHENKPPDIRMNGSCAGGTGAFIDQIATLLHIPLDQLNDLAVNHTSIYSIASRCGVFAKTDVQNLLSRKIPKEDIVASVFHAVVVQTLNTLTRGFDIKPKIMFSGGPFTFLPELKKFFLKSLNFTMDDIIPAEHAELLPAIGAALTTDVKGLLLNINELREVVRTSGEKKIHKNYRLNPLFKSREEYDNWMAGRVKTSIQVLPISEYVGDFCYLGIDSGSTTTKITVTGVNNELLFTYYSNNKGNSINTVTEGLKKFLFLMEENNRNLTIRRAAVTGYGEDLIRAALRLDKGIVETIAHYKAARFFNEKVSFIMDIGGQDMKAIFIDDEIINRIELNESCSSGCGSFIETFGNALGHKVEDFAQMACDSVEPCDLGTRCTVFMNSKVKQALRENAGTEDIAAGLAISVIKNALFKVLKVKDMSLLGDHIVVQGGTFRNPSVHRALEVLTGKEVICSNIPELMGAFGAALVAKDIDDPSTVSTFIGMDRLNQIDQFTNKQLICKGCVNNCTITKFIFITGEQYYSGNKCEQIFSNKGSEEISGENLADYKYSLLFDRILVPQGKPKLKIGIPRVLNMFDNFPFWQTLFVECGIEIVLSQPSSMKLYEDGQGTIMSDSICFPAKLVHGHVMDLMQKKVDRIFYPIVVFESDEFCKAENTFNCPIVTGYPDVIRSAVDPYGKEGIPLDTPTINLRDKQLLRKAMYQYLKKFGVGKNSFNNAIEKALLVNDEFKRQVRLKVSQVVEKAKAEGRMVFVLAGRPYHIDPLINQKTAEVLKDLGVDVITEDIPINELNQLDGLQVITQWHYPNRIYNIAKWVADQPWNVQLVQLNSFGCGPDAIVIDEAIDILKEKGKNHTLIRVDEITSTGSVRLRLRSMIESFELKRDVKKASVKRITTATFTEDDKEKIILAPIFSEVYSTFIPTLFELSGYKLVNLPPPNKESVDIGLKYANNEICYPSTIIVGDIIKALQSGKYDLSKVAIGISQTGGQCRATSYLSLIKKAMVSSGFQDIPVIAVGTGGITINDQPGFVVDWKKVMTISFISTLYADSLQKMYYSTVVREKEKGRAKDTLNFYLAKVQSLVREVDSKGIYALLAEAVLAFNSIEADNNAFPKIGIVGEIYVKYNSFGNHFVLNWLVEQGIEVVVPPLVDFFTQAFVNMDVNKKSKLSRAEFSDFYVYFIEHLANKHVRKTNRVLKNFKFYGPFHNIRDLAKKAKKILNLANQYGEGWLIPAEISTFAEDGVTNIVSVQPFGCIANHVVSKGVEKRMKDIYPDLNLLYLDMDDGASQVNLINRLHFMVKNVKERTYGVVPMVN